MNPLRFALFAVVSACAASNAAPASSGAVQEPQLVLDGLTVIPMTDEPARTGPTSILIRGERIVALYPTGSRAAPAGARRLDLRGRYAIPGLVDGHVHLTGGLPRASQQDSLLEFLLLGGITAVRDMAGDGVLLGERARAAQNGATRSPRIDYATLVGSPAHFSSDRRAPAIARGGTPGQLAWMRAIAADSDAARAVAGAREIGATGLKAYAGLNRAQLAAAAREAHARGLKMWAHASVGPAKPGDAVAAGVDVLSHASYLAPELLDSLPAVYGQLIDRLRYDRPATEPALGRLFADMQRRGTMLDPTLFVSRRLGRSRAVLEGELRNMQGVDAWGVDATRLAHQAGVRLIAGTDVSGYPGRDPMPTLHDELAIYVNDVGLTPLEALATATRSSGLMLGAERDFGTIAAGRLADLVILDADPRDNIRNSRRIAFVVKGGVVHAAPPRDTLDWRPSWPGTEIAVLEGDLAGPGAWAFLFRMPGGYWIYPHTHPVDANIRVISGTFLAGMGATLDSTAARVLAPGDSIRLAAGMAHFEGTRGGATVIEVRGRGAWGITFLDPARAPR